MIRSLSLVLAGLGLAAAAAQPRAAEPARPAAFRWPEGKKAALSLTFDDARTTQVDTGTPLFAEFGVRATFYAQPEGVGKRLPQWKQAVAAGHEIGNHTTTHPCTGNFAWSRANALEDYDLARIERDIRETSLFVARELGKEPVSFAYPCGQSFVGRGENVRSYVPVVARVFRSGRMYMGETGNDPSYCDLAQLQAVSLDGLTFEDARPFVEQALKDGLWLIFAGHEIGGTAPQTTRTDTLAALCRFARDPANGVWIDTVDAVSRHVLRARDTAGAATR
jgi:peptidoglycan/xylan/chitin deacetylase (PgdA/CDA1 family)